MTAPPPAPRTIAPARALWRAIRCRCPTCGATRLFRRWILIRSQCPACGAPTDRGAPGHFVGAYLVNLIAAELLFAIGFLLWGLATWPDVPWMLMERLGALAMVVAPIVLYPVTRTLWLAIDLVLDPVHPGAGWSGPTDPQ